MSDLIERDKVIEYCLKLIDVERKQGSDVMNYGQERINQTDTIIAFVENLPSARPKGEWMEREVLEDTVINEWQSARCSECGKYHTTPYMYYFDNFNFCPNCGADMREREGE